MFTAMLKKASQWLAEKRDKHLAIKVHYVTKDGVVKKCKATLGSTTFNAPNEHGIYVRTAYRDFLISVQELKHIPEYGDMIVWNDGIFEVLAPQNRCVWRWSDAYRSTKRIHTKYFKEAGGIYEDADDDATEDSENSTSGSTDGGGTSGGTGDSNSGSDSFHHCCPCNRTITVSVQMCNCCEKRNTCQARMTTM